MAWPVSSTKTKPVVHTAIHNNSCVVLFLFFLFFVSFFYHDARSAVEETVGSIACVLLDRGILQNVDHWTQTRNSCGLVNISRASRFIFFKIETSTHFVVCELNDPDVSVQFPLFNQMKQYELWITPDCDIEVHRLFARHPPFFADRVARLFVIRLGLWWYKVLLVHLLNCVGRIILGARQITTGLCERSTNATNKKYTSCGTTVQQLVESSAWWNGSKRRRTVNNNSNCSERYIIFIISFLNGPKNIKK